MRRYRFIISILVLAPLLQQGVPHRQTAVPIAGCSRSFLSNFEWGHFAPHANAYINFIEFILRAPPGKQVRFTNKVVFVEVSDESLRWKELFFRAVNHYSKGSVSITEIDPASCPLQIQGSFLCFRVVHDSHSRTVVVYGEGALVHTASTN